MRSGLNRFSCCLRSIISVTLKILVAFCVGFAYAFQLTSIFLNTVCVDLMFMCLHLHTVVDDLHGLRAEGPLPSGVQVVGLVGKLQDDFVVGRVPQLWRERLASRVVTGGYLTCWSAMVTWGLPRWPGT